MKSFVSVDLRSTADIQSEIEKIPSNGRNLVIMIRPRASWGRGWLEGEDPGIDLPGRGEWLRSLAKTLDIGCRELPQRV